MAVLTAFHQSRFVGKSSTVWVRAHVSHTATSRTGSHIGVVAPQIAQFS
jgi:hypothetical protein